MEFLELAKKRFSTRRYSAKKVEKELLDKILEAGRVAPTAANHQPQKILVVTSDEGKAKIDKAATVYSAPAILIVCADLDQGWVRNYDSKNCAEIDATIVTTHMMLQATELELGSLWLTWFDPDVIKREFDLPENIIPVNLLALGYDEGEPKPSGNHFKRKPISETVYYETIK